MAMPLGGTVVATRKPVAWRAERRTKTRSNKWCSVRKGGIWEAGLRVVKELGAKEEEQPIQGGKDKQPVGEERVCHYCPH